MRLGTALGDMDALYEVTSMSTPTALAKLPIPTGDPWTPTPEDPATVAVPLPVIIVSVEGP